MYARMHICTHGVTRRDVYREKRPPPTPPHALATLSFSTHLTHVRYPALRLPPNPLLVSLPAYSPRRRTPSTHLSTSSRHPLYLSAGALLRRVAH